MAMLALATLLALRRRVRSAFRPATRDEVGFCAVCRRAMERVIALYARPAAAGR